MACVRPAGASSLTHRRSQGRKSLSAEARIRSLRADRKLLPTPSRTATEPVGRPWTAPDRPRPRSGSWPARVKLLHERQKVRLAEGRLKFNPMTRPTDTSGCRARWSPRRPTLPSDTTPRNHRERVIRTLSSIYQKGGRPRTSAPCAAFGLRSSPSPETIFTSLHPVTLLRARRSPLGIRLPTPTR
jgi:hypothetical protein